MSYDQVSAKDREKLSFLLGTWEERKLIEVAVLAKLRAHVIIFNANASAGPPSVAAVSSHSHCINLNDNSNCDLIISSFL